MSHNYPEGANDPHSLQPVSHLLSPNEDISDHNLSNELRELAEDENKSALVTDNPQKTQENGSKIEQQSMHNTMLANSELIQLPIQQFYQQQTGLRLSSPLPTNQRVGFPQNAYPRNTQVIHQNQSNLRSTLPPPNAVPNQIYYQSNPYSQNWVTQPATTQARVQSSNSSFAFPVGSPAVPQQMPRLPNSIQSQQLRPNSTSPKKITFNYHSNPRNVSPPPVNPSVHPQQPQVQPNQPPNNVPSKPNGNALNVNLNPNPNNNNNNSNNNNNNNSNNNNNNSNNSNFNGNSNQPILPTPPPNVNQGEVAIWQQRYFIILQKFQYYYQRLEIIHKKSIYLHDAISQTKKVEELQLLKSQSHDLLLLITSTEQELTETIHRNRELLTQATNWKQKYEELSRSYQTLKQTQMSNNQELLNKVDQLDRQLVELETNYHTIVKKNDEEMGKNRQLQQELAILNEQLRSNTAHPTGNEKELELKVAQLSRMINEKNDIIAQLSRDLKQKERKNPSSHPEHNNPTELYTQLRHAEDEIQSNQQLINELRLQNKRLHDSFKQLTIQSEAKIIKYQEFIFECEGKVQNKDSELKRYIALVQSKNTEIANISRQSGSQQNSPRNSEIEIQNRRLKHQLTVYEESHASDLKIFNGKVQELLDKIKMISSERDSTVGNLQEKATLLQSDLNRKDGTIRNLRDRILELEEEKRIKDLDKKYEPKRTDEKLVQSQEYNSLRRQLNDKTNEIEELQAQLTEYKRIANEYEDTLRAKKHQINALKRDIEEKSQGAQDSVQLNEQLNKRNEELKQLRLKLVDLEKTSNQNEVLRQENINLNDALRKKHVELAESSDKIYLLEKKVRELETLSDNSPKLAQLAQECELLQNAISKKDQEIVKLRQSSQLLQSNINELQLEADRLKSKLNAGERLSQSERGELKSKISVLQIKAIEYERKIAGLEEVRAIMNEQINTLTAEIHIKFENTQRLELELKQERTRSKAFESETEMQLIETEEVRNKLREWERKYQALSKQFQAEVEKKKDLTNTKKNEVFNLNNKCVELQNACKNKDAKIKDLQRSAESLSSKIRNLDNNLEEIEYLKHKISEYQHKISYQNHKFASTRLPDLESTQIFERKVIYQLKMENQNLRKQLGLAPKPEGKEINIPERDSNNVNQRLNDFNKKLEEIISENAVIDYNLSGDELYKKFERDRRLLIEKHNEEITQLKVKILELQGGHGNSFPKKYTNINQIFNQQLDFYREKNQELEQRVENHIKVNRDLKQSLELLLKAQSGEHSITYYKEQYEKSSDAIVNLQKQLKKVNQELKKLKEEASKMNTSKYTQTNVEVEARIIEFSRKITQLTQQINFLEKERVGKEQTINKSETEVKRLKSLIEELKSSKDELQKLLNDKESTFQDELTKANNKLRINQSQIERLNEMLSKRHDQESSEHKNFKGRITELQEENKKLKTRVEELIISEEKYTREINKLENQIQVLLAEIQRLKETVEGVGKRHRQGDNELQNLRVTINEYEGRIRGLESLKETYSYRENQLQQEVSRSSNQIRLLQSEVERLTDFTQKKVSQKDSEIARLKLLINERIDENSHLEDHLRDLKVLSFKSNDAAQEIFNLKEEINNLRVSYNLKNTESENRLREVYELNDKIRYLEEQFILSKRITESKVIEQQTIITSLQSQLTDIRRLKDSSSSDSGMRVQSLEEQLRSLKYQKEQEILSLNARIAALQSQSRESRRGMQQTQEITQERDILQQRYEQLSYQYSVLNQNYNQIVNEYDFLKLELQKREETINQIQIHISFLENELNVLQNKSGSTHGLDSLVKSSRYSLEFVRSVLIEIETLLKEEGTTQPAVMEIVEREINSALEECKRWNQSLSI